MESSHQCDRTDWAPGPWDQEPDRVEWTHHGTPCLAIRNQFGAWCGYAGVRPGHPLYRVPFNAASMNIEVHGGLTYSDNCQGDVCHMPSPGDTDEIWWCGFDCCHVYDRAPGMEALLRRLDGPHEVFGTYRDLDYVRAETEALADQLHAYKR